jgi:hypothetical protein
VAYFKILVRYLSGRTEENNENFKSRHRSLSRDFELDSLMRRSAKVAFFLSTSGNLPIQHLPFSLKQFATLNFV